MHPITLEDVEKVSRLAKLEFTGEEKDLFLAQFSKIIGFVEKIGELDTEKIKPMTHAVEKSNVLRQDEIGKSMKTEELAKISPRFEDGSIVVPRIIDY